MKVLIDLGNLEPMKGDELRFDGEKWVCVSHNASFSEERKRIEVLEREALSTKTMLIAEVKNLKDKISTIAKAVEELL